MKTIKMRPIFLGALIIASICSVQASMPLEPDSIRNATINVFLDCPYCDFDYVRTEIPYVNYVRDRFSADVHILITEQETGGGGTEHTLDLIGEKSYAGMEDTLRYYSLADYADDEIRKGLVQTLKLGLIRFLAHTPLADYLSINYELTPRPEATRDKWHHWVYTVSPTFQLSGSSPSHQKRLGGSLSLVISRVTYASKTIIGVFSNYAEDRHKYPYPLATSNITIYRDWRISALRVQSLNEHWSAGAFGFANGSSDTYRNGSARDIAAFIAPTLEYDIFPYNESTRRIFTIDCSLGAEYNYMRDKLDIPHGYFYYSKWQPLTELDAGATIIQPWGNITATFSNRQYLDNIEHNSQNLHGRLSWRLSKGLFLDFDAQWHRDNGFPSQLNRPNRYSYSTMIGFTGIFGSIYNNIVNPRMIL